MAVLVLGLDHGFRVQAQYDVTAKAITTAIFVWRCYIKQKSLRSLKKIPLDKLQLDQATPTMISMQALPQP